MTLEANTSNAPSNSAEGTSQEQTNMAPDATVKTTAKLTLAKGKTRGKNPRDIEYERFDREMPDTLPKSLEEFSAVTGVVDEPGIVDLLIDGYNLAQYSAASDEIGEFINDEWSKEFQLLFRNAVRSYSKLSGDSIEDTVALVKPGVDKKWAAMKIEAAKPKEEVKETVNA